MDTSPAELKHKPVGCLYKDNKKFFHREEGKRGNRTPNVNFEVFICHPGHLRATVAFPLYILFHYFGVETLSEFSHLDRVDSTGGELDSALYDAIENSRTMVALISDQFWLRQYCPAECELYLRLKGKPGFFPVLWKSNKGALEKQGQLKGYGQCAKGLLSIGGKMVNGDDRNNTLIIWTELFTRLQKQTGKSPFRDEFRNMRETERWKRAEEVYSEAVQAYSDDQQAGAVTSATVARLMEKLQQRPDTSQTQGCGQLVPAQRLQQQQQPFSRSEQLIPSLLEIPGQHFTQIGHVGGFDLEEFRATLRIAKLTIEHMTLKSGVGEFAVARKGQEQRKFMVKWGNHPERGEVQNHLGEARAFLMMPEHENIVRLEHLMALGRFDCLFFEQTSKSLGSFMESPNAKISQAAFTRAVEQIFRGLAVVHESGLVHKDINPENILLVASNTGDDFCFLLKLGNFDWAEPCEKGEIVKAPPVGAVEILAPEARGELASFGAPQDVWAAAVTVALWWTNPQNWRHNRHRDWRVWVPPEFLMESLPLLRECLAEDPSVRPRALTFVQKLSREWRAPPRRSGKSTALTVAGGTFCGYRRRAKNSAGKRMLRLVEPVVSGPDVSDSALVLYHCEHALIQLPIIQERAKSARLGFLPNRKLFLTLYEECIGRLREAERHAHKPEDRLVVENFKNVFTLERMKEANRYFHRSEGSREQKQPQELEAGDGPAFAKEIGMKRLSSIVPFLEAGTGRQAFAVKRNMGVLRGELARAHLVLGEDAECKRERIQALAELDEALGQLEAWHKSSNVHPDPFLDRLSATFYKAKILMEIGKKEECISLCEDMLDSISSSLWTLRVTYGAKLWYLKLRALEDGDERILVCCQSLLALYRMYIQSSMEAQLLVCMNAMEHLGFLETLKRQATEPNLSADERRREAHSILDSVRRKHEDTSVCYTHADT